MKPWKWALGGLLLLAALIWWGVKSRVFSSRDVASHQIFARESFILDGEGDPLIRSIKIRLAQDLIWLEEQNGWRLQLNSFSNPTAQGSRSACEQYQQVILRLLATGVIVSGQAPQLTLVMECQESNEQIILPAISFADIQARVLRQNTWSASGVEYRAENLDEEWLSEWSIGEIQLVPRGQAPFISIDSIEIQAVRPGAGDLQLNSQ